MFLSASISTVSSDWLVGLQGDRFLFILQMHSVQGWCWLCQRLQGGNLCQWSCPHDQKNLPKDFHQSLQDPRCSWRLCRLCTMCVSACIPNPAWQQAASIHLLPEFSLVCLTLLLQLSFGDTHFIPAALHGTYTLGSCSSLLESHFCPTAHPWSYRHSLCGSHSILVLAGILLILFPRAGTVLCYQLRIRTMLIIHKWFSCC